MYSSAFCRVYDAFGWNYYPEAFAGQLLRWLGQRGVSVADSLDLGCGTGILCQRLAERGINAMGIDLSESMIDIARRRAPRLRFEVRDMAAWRPDGRFDLVTCTGDALNHLFDLEDVRRTFSNVRACLRPGGYFIFDLLNEGEIPPDEPFELDYSDAVRARFHTTREAGGIVNLDIAVFEHGRLAFEEHIREKVHDLSAVLDLLRGEGLAIEQCADHLPEGDNHGTTLFIVAQRR